MNKAFFIVMAFLSFFGNIQMAVAGSDTRFQVYLPNIHDDKLTIQETMTLALPTLWQRIIPTQSLKKATRLRGRTSLVLQVKRKGEGINLVFNPVQVQAYLQQHHINMIVEQPHWNLRVVCQGFDTSNAWLAQDLMNDRDTLSDVLGLQLDAQGRKLELRFTQVVNDYGEAHIELAISGAFSTTLLDEVRQPVQNDRNHQLHTWLYNILRNLRDISLTQHANWDNDVSILYMTVMSDASLAAQVALEQLLQQQSEVVSVIPTVIQQNSRQYRVVLRGADDSWVSSWFASYGMAAVKRPLDSPNQWWIE